MGSILVEMFKHNVWANDVLMEACAALSDEQLDARVDGTYGNIGDTLAHIAGAQERYVAGLTGGQWQRLEEEGLALREVRERLRQSSQALIDFAGQHTEDTVIHGVRRGEPFALLASVFLTQAINHATEHRAQIATTLTQIGITPPVMDGWTYDDTRAGESG
jgi:uncharacterized damage-inducible protein DinB